MAESYVATPTPYDGSTPMPEDGDALDAASARAALEKHADALAAVSPAVLGTSSDPWIHQWHPSAFNGCVAEAWPYAAGDWGQTVVQVTADPDDPFRFAVELFPPHGAHMQAVRLWAYHPSADARVRVFRSNFEAFTTAGYSITSGYMPTRTQLGDETDQSALNPDVSYIDAAITDALDVNRSRFRYYAIVTGVLRAATADEMWLGCALRVQ